MALSDLLAIQEKMHESLFKVDKKRESKYVSPFEGSCISMNKCESHTKTYKKTQLALMKV